MATFTITNFASGETTVEADSYTHEEGYFNFVKGEDGTDGYINETQVFSITAKHVHSIRRD